MQDFEQAIKYFTIIEDKFPNEAYVKDCDLQDYESLYNLKHNVQLKEKSLSSLKYSRKTPKRTFICISIWRKPINYSGAFSKLCGNTT